MMALMNKYGTAVERQLTGKTKIICPSTVLFFMNQTWVVLGLNPFLRGQKMAKNGLIFGTVRSFPVFFSPRFGL
jgi:hypothetical protein